MTRPAFYPLLIAALLLAAPIAHAQDKGTVDPRPLPPLANPNDPKNPAAGRPRPRSKRARSASMPTGVSPAPSRCR
jgi:penicillin-insensitive murein endopeptidase